MLPSAADVAGWLPSSPAYENREGEGSDREGEPRAT
jgi:hypothetical protein